MLAMLEARFHEDVANAEGSVRRHSALDQVPKPQRTHNHEIESSRLSNKEMEIVVEVDKALKLLKDEGTAVAFPLAVEQVREDMEQVVQRPGAGQGG